jgi:ATP-dependent DNA helicase RecQ
LADIARRRPKTSDELKTVSGVGQSKLTRYGADVLRIVREY